MVLISDSYSEHVAQASRKIGPFEEKNTNMKAFLNYSNALSRSNNSCSLREHLFLSYCIIEVPWWTLHIRRESLLSRGSKMKQSN